ncbi:MAG: hypothetical protein A3B08_02250 [Candidatus Taylorbacteria bacterium RIFCSPLOWO2_01_FULL_43_44]|nr:MAG: hypothetical protein A2743_01470 [Candidatus Taylorbacteria bacterium RIFCSPHIGHO2_01_FULL_43_47]OHA29897.1 MAG: hypothetical protein A3B08_02250 [Candidatus Taylorbacteria bacterium RIFCSPLOWO2_01_FULL_43_44]
MKSLPKAKENCSTILISPGSTFCISRNYIKPHRKQPSKMFTFFSFSNVDQKSRQKNRPDSILIESGPAKFHANLQSVLQIYPFTNFKKS